jgi:hypothetical protein
MKGVAGLANTRSRSWHSAKLIVQVVPILLSSGGGVLKTSSGGVLSLKQSSRIYWLPRSDQQVLFICSQFHL